MKLLSVSHLTKRIITLVIACSFAIVYFNIHAEKTANSEYIKNARLLLIDNEYGTASIVFTYPYADKLTFCTLRGNDVDKVFEWTDCKVSVFPTRIIIKGKDKDDNNTKITIEKDNKNYSIWVEIRTKSGRLQDDFGIKEINNIAFGLSEYNCRKSKNQKSGFELCKEWFTIKLN